MGRSSARVDVDGLVRVLYVCKDIMVAEYAHRALVVNKYPVWIKAPRVFIHVVRYLVKARAWRGLRVAVILVVRLRVVFCFSIALVCFVVNVHT